MTTWWQGVPAGAACAIHPDRPATASCPRCGAFACQECVQGAMPLCPPCRARVERENAFPFDGRGWTIGGLVEVAWRAFKREWLLLSVAVLVFTGLLMAISLVGTLAGAILAKATGWALLPFRFLFSLVQQLLMGLLTIGMMKLSIEVLQGRPANVALLFTEMTKAGRYVVAGLVSFVAISAPAQLLADALTRSMLLPAGGAPGAGIAWPFGDSPVALAIGAALLIPWSFFVGIPLQFAPAEIAATDSGGVRVLYNCFAIVRGERWRLLAVMLLSIPIVVAGMTACCIGVLPGGAIAQLLFAGAYLCVRHRVDRGSPAHPS